MLEMTLPQASTVKIEFVISGVSVALLSVQIGLRRFTIFSTVPLAGTTSAGTPCKGVELGDGEGVGVGAGEDDGLTVGVGVGEGVGAPVGVGV